MPGEGLQGPALKARGKKGTLPTCPAPSARAHLSSPARLSRVSGLRMGREGPLRRLPHVPTVPAVHGGGVLRPCWAAWTPLQQGALLPGSVSTSPGQRSLAQVPEWHVSCHPMSKAQPHHGPSGAVLDHRAAETSRDHLAVGERRRPRVVNVARKQHQLPRDCGEAPGKQGQPEHGPGHSKAPRLRVKGVLGLVDPGHPTDKASPDPSPGQLHCDLPLCRS